MGNLGDYQKMTEFAKKVGGPKVLVVTTLIVGYVIIRPGEAVARRSFQRIKRGSTPCPTRGQVFQVTSDGDDDGIAFRVGGEYRVLECDGDAILVEVLGNRYNPYFVSRDFLRSVSDFPPDDRGEGSSQG